MTGSVFNALFSSHATYRFCISSLKTGDAGFDTNPLPGILNCLGSLFLYRVV